MEKGERIEVRLKEGPIIFMTLKAAKIAIDAGWAMEVLPIKQPHEIGTKTIPAGVSGPVPMITAPVTVELVVDAEHTIPAAIVLTDEQKLVKLTEFRQLLTGKNKAILQGFANSFPKTEWSKLTNKALVDYLIDKKHTELQIK